jgi:hypothetical protein
MTASEFVLYLTPEQVTGSFYLARLVGETALLVLILKENHFLLMALDCFVCLDWISRTILFILLLCGGGWLR